MHRVSLFDAPAAGFDEPFAMLGACHDRVRRSLALLERLLAHVRAQGADGAAQSAARDVLRYFTRAAPAHHEDEERHVVPALRACDSAAAHEAAERLLRDHKAIRAAWAALEPALRLVEAGTAPLDGVYDAARHFVALHDDHLRLEDEVAFPLATSTLAARGAAALAAMGDEMAQRRGVPPRGPPPA